MTTRKRLGLGAVLVLLAALIGICGWSLYTAVQQEQKNAALIAAIKRDDVRAAENLLQKGADPNARDTTDRRTLWERVQDWVLHKTHREVGTTALEVVLMRYPGYDETGWKRSEPMLLALIKHGADPNARDDEGVTALLRGCYYDDKALVDAALAQGARVNPPGHHDFTPLMAAASTADAEMVHSLLAHGAQVNRKAPDGETTLMYALRVGYPSSAFVKTVKILLEHSAAVNVKDANGDTPLKRAAHWNRPDLVTLLKQHGAKE